VASLGLILGAGLVIRPSASAWFDAVDQPVGSGD
jgi:hypothetical protein